MLQTKPNSAKLHEDGDRNLGRQGAAFAEAMSETSRAPPEETTRALEKTFSIVATGAADFHHQWMEIVRYNTNSTLDFVQQLFSVKSPAEFLELSSAHLRTQFETFAEQSRHLSGMAQKITIHAVEPFRRG
jgi:phasin family protein